VEVLLAITITGFVLSMAAGLVVSISNIWINRQQAFFFDDHVDGVTEFIQSSFTTAGMEIALNGNDSQTAPRSGSGNGSNPDDSDPSIDINLDGNNQSLRSSRNASKGGSGLVRVAEAPIAWAQPPGFASFRDPLLNLKLSKTPPILVNTDNAPALGVSVFLHHDRDEGLSLLWYSVLQEEAEDENDLRRTQISPFVTQIRYIYWDERFERWEEEETPKEGDGDEFILPRFIKLIFEYEGETKERTVSIPVPSRSALLF
jgi:hypothetical protein